MISDIKLCDFINGADLINIPRTTQVIIRSMLSQDLSNRPMLDEILVLIFKKIFFLVQDMNEFTYEIGERYFTLTKISREVKFSFPDNFKNREKEDFKSLNQLYRKNYSFSKVRNDFYFLVNEDDKFIFHYAMNCFLNEKLDSVSLFYLGHLLKDNYCSYMIDSMMILEYHIAFDAQKVNPDMRQSFLSLESDNIKNYLIIFPQKLDDKNCSRSTKDLIQNASGSYAITESKLSDKLLNSFIYFDINYYVYRIRVKFDDDMIEKLKSFILYIGDNIGKWKFSNIDIYYLILSLYQMNFKGQYLIYFAYLTKNENFIERIRKMFLSKQNQTISLLEEQRISVDNLFLMGNSYKYLYLYNATSNENIILKKYYAWMQFINFDDDYLLILFEQIATESDKNSIIKILESFKKLRNDMGYSTLQHYQETGRFKNMRNMLEKMVFQSSAIKKKVFFYIIR